MVGKPRRTAVTQVTPISSAASSTPGTTPAMNSLPALVLVLTA
jgi:hypothetical protein